MNLISELTEKQFELEEVLDLMSELEEKAEALQREINELNLSMCPLCEGTGETEQKGETYPDFVIDKCNQCNGTGRD